MAEAQLLGEKRENDQLKRAPDRRSRPWSAKTHHFAIWRALVNVCPEKAPLKRFLRRGGGVGLAILAQALCCILCTGEVFGGCHHSPNRG
jgi:hypothetical protein